MLKSEMELGTLIGKEEKGILTNDEEKELDRRLGNFYKITLFGTVYKINHCFVARAFIGLCIVSFSLSIIWVAHHEIYKEKK